MSAIFENLKALGRTRLLVLGGVGLALVFTLLFGFNQVTKPSYGPLYSGLSASDASEMVRTLEGAGIQTDVSSDGSVLSVPRGDFARARMALADQGLPSQGAPGWELFDGGSGLGMNSFMQQVNRNRALEGELARSIQTLDSVEAARVHLVLPERENFSRERAEPSASVVLRTRGSRSLDKKQAQSIQHLVASSVPGLSPTKVTVLSADGGVILAENEDGPAEASLQTTKAAMEDRYAQNIEKILSARVGAGNVRAEVTVDLSSERRVVISESFNPSEQVVRSTETLQESEEGIEAGASDVSVANNLPEAALGGAPSGAQSKNTRNKSNEVVNYEIGSTRSETVYEPGQLQRISVAVLVNGIFERDDADGDAVYKDRTPEELAQIEELVQTAIGFDQARNDAISVRSMRFMDYSMDLGEPVRVSMLDILSENIMTIVQGFLSLVMVAMVLLLGVKPVLSRVLPAQIAPQNDEDEAQTDPTGEAEGNEKPAPENTGKATQADLGEDAIEEMVDLASVTGGVRKRRISSLGELVAAEEEDAVRLLRHWISDNGGIKG